MAASSNALAQGLQGYNFMLTPDANAKMRSIGQESALAEALRSQGMEPIDTKGRSIGGVGYAISPMEGYAKIAQQLVGAYGQYDTNKQYSDLMNPQGSLAPTPAPTPTQQPDADSAANGVAPSLQGAYPGDAPPQVGAPGFAVLPDASQAPPQQNLQGPFSPAFTGALQAIQQKYNLSPMEAMQLMQDPSALSRVVAANAPTPEMKNARDAYGAAGAPAAIRNIMDLQQYPGQKSMQEGLGNAAAAQAPAGTAPAGPGLPGMPQRAPASFPPPVSGYTIQNDGIHMPVPPPAGVGGVQGMPQQGNAFAPSPGMPEAMPPGAQTTLQNAAQPAGGMPALNTAGMSNAQVAAAVDAQKAGAAARASKEGENLGNAENAAASIDSRMGAAKKTLAHIIDLAPRTSSGMGIGMKEDWANQFNGKVAADNKDFTIASGRLFLQELPAVMSSLSNRGNQFMERKIQEAGSIDIADHPQAKIRAAQMLSDALDQAKQMSDTNVAVQGGSAPGSVHWVIGPNGTLVKQ